ncbi:MAG TPA: tRNA pseudouridine(38-40) synthase TruA [Nevskiaceae bacterium]|nr:tRNA pseudouridine(38-40) synthase TruA [Nevskiaceae bacterium]
MPEAAPPARQRWAAAVEYRGSAYAGWQAQSHAPSVQAAVEAALSRVADHPVAVSCAGRTDAGVHALGQVIHFDSPRARSADAWLLGSNVHLPDDIKLRWVQPVAAAFDARHSALGRRYRYVILNRRARGALLAGAAAWVPQPLDAERMHEAAQALLGERDFSSFRAAGCQSRTPMRCLTFIRVWRVEERLAVEVWANAFLHHMVRNLVGSLLEIGRGERPVSWMAELLAQRDRTQAGETAPAEGLYFLGADYPAAFGLPPPANLWLP